jgi:hypothetical protein
MSKYYVSYSPFNLATITELPLHDRSLARPILFSASSNNVNGEYFDSSGANNRVRLFHNPYIDYGKFLEASYSKFYGTVTSPSTSLNNFNYSEYSPVKVLFLDGTFARNITNYVNGSSEIESFYETDQILFIQDGDSIMFNQQVRKPFRVLYQYLPNSFRYRIVLRTLTNDSINYSVDRLIFKFSTDERDNMLIKLSKYDNLFKSKSI